MAMFVTQFVLCESGIFYSTFSTSNEYESSCGILSAIAGIMRVGMQAGSRWVALK